MKQGKAKYIACILKKKIDGGEYGADRPLPSVRTLMRTYGIALGTAHRVLHELAASRVSRRENRLLARDARVETREGLRTSDFGLPGPLTTND